MKYKWWFWGLLLFLLSFLVDKVVVNYISDNRIFSLDSTITKFTIFTNGIFSLIIIGLMILIWKRKYIFSYLLGFGSITIVMWLIKNIIRRDRPFFDLNTISLIPDESGFSFPSGHAGFAFFTLAFVWKLFPKFRWIWLVITILIAIARVYSVVHYLSDVIAGVMLGLFFGTYFVKSKFLNFKSFIRK